jgi:hypothetical protein
MSDEPQFVTDEAGERTAVLLPIRRYEQLLEDLEALAANADRWDEETIPHDEFVQQLKEDGLLSN